MDVLHSDVVSSLVLTDFIDVCDVRVGNGRGSTSLLLKTTDALSVFDEGGWQQLQRDAAIQARIVGKVYLSHATAAEQFEQLIGTYSLALQRLVFGAHQHQPHAHQ